jgi:hypothetical protein
MLEGFENILTMLISAPALGYLVYEITGPAARDQRTLCVVRAGRGRMQDDSRLTLTTLEADPKWRT